MLKPLAVLNSQVEDIKIFLEIQIAMRKHGLNGAICDRSLSDFLEIVENQDLFVYLTHDLEIFKRFEEVTHLLDNPKPSYEPDNIDFTTNISLDGSIGGLFENRELNRYYSDQYPKLKPKIDQAISDVLT